MTNDLLHIDRSLSVGSLSSYIHWANQIPLLTKDEEQDLARKLRENDDIEAARKMIMSHLRLVISIARGYSGYGLPQADLIQEGNIGLMKAVKRFNPDVGVRLVSFAIHWIRAEMHEFIIKNWRIVKIATTKGQRKLFFNLRKMSKKRGWFSEDEVSTIAETLNVNHKDIRQMEARLNNYDTSFDAYDDDDDSPASWGAPANYLEDDSLGPLHRLEHNDWASNRHEKLHAAMATLDERSQDILRLRWLQDDKQTLHQLAEKYQISAERVRQLEKTAMQKLQQQIAD
jgi:RNA polymerase sigma-32 factor